ncbi:uncharacterized protein EDB93DRAFT_1171541 [Suillus bovinus]|uniref:uncharacterized protein n=1 Tax=Suillus bovinus TaxID=48563 RepID=UPI001B86D1D9|nr:uncharacterized protein EDB93DRAFT_1171541 [Suillus bovinus]KAG2135228.1 hypothetical protein EDB93DRAFT_1171541 [Suillus bovinus]
MSIHVFSLPANFGRFHEAYLRLSQHFQQFRSLHIAIKDWTLDFIKSYDPWNHKTLESILRAIAIILVLFLVIRFWTTSCSRSPTKDSHCTALQALQTVLVPSCSLWPARYIRLVKHASNKRNGSRIIVPLSMLLQDVYDGVIELRNPLYDLEDLIDQGVRAYGCSISLKIEWKWWLRGDVSDNTKGFDVPPPSADHRTLINLNNHPLRHLATIQLPEGSRTTLAFTTLSNHIFFLSTLHIICMIPFLTHRLPHRFSDIIATVNETPHFKLLTLTNTSAVYADTLAALSNKVTYDPVARQQCVDELGIKGWRKRRLMLEFEAVLVRRGWLERWNVVLQAR